MQIPIVNGIYTDSSAEFRTSYPVNLVPVPKEQGISKGYLRPADGIVAIGSGGPGIDRGGINWNGAHYRVMGTSLVSVDADGAVTELGFVGGSEPVHMDYSFDYLSIVSDGRLYLYNGELRQVTSPNLGTVLDAIWIDGYFVTTDGTYLVVTELNNPFEVNPLKYGSSEIDPDPIEAIIKFRNEIYALNRYTIEVFQNIGSTGFPFQRINGAQIDKGTMGSKTACVFIEGIAFLGSGHNESPAVWLGLGGSATKISTREIDQLLAEYTEEDLADAIIEAHTDKGHRHLYIHLSDKTLVYDAAATAVLSIPIWYILKTNGGLYRARHMVWVHDHWFVGDPLTSAIGTLSSSFSSHWGAVNDWEFSTGIIYNAAAAAVFHQLELICLPGRGVNSTIYTDYSADGQTWSQPKAAASGVPGDRNKRILWLQQGTMRQWRIQRFRGKSECHLSIAALEAQIEGMAY